MPKLIVLFFDADGPATAVAEAVADGAKGVRFTEVDLRSAVSRDSAATQRHKQLDSAERIKDYDGIVIVPHGNAPAGLIAVLNELERAQPADSFTNKVFAVAGSDDATLLGRVARLGGIIVADPRGMPNGEVRARALGARVAKVVEWVRHALSHEQTASQHHHHH